VSKQSVVNEAKTCNRLVVLPVVEETLDASIDDHVLRANLGLQHTHALQLKVPAIDARNTSYADGGDFFLHLAELSRHDLVESVPFALSITVAMKYNGKHQTRFQTGGEEYEKKSEKNS
jgi:hypothetical protein